MRSAIILLLSCLISIILVYADKDSMDGGKWEGYFEQTKPLPWKGKMLLSITYDLRAEEGLPVNGIIVWQGLQQSITKVTGIRNNTKIVFNESECISESCAVKLGGRYIGEFNDAYDQLNGTATIEKSGYQGKFNLRLVRKEDEKR